MKPKIFAIVNQKGGIGKTTSAMNIGAGLALMKKKVLLVDLDQQCNLTLSLLGNKNFEQNMYKALRGENQIPEIPVVDNLCISPSHPNLASIELELSMEPGRENLLKKLLSKVENDYDYVLLDCPPSLSLITINALNAAKYVLIPLQAQYLASQGLSRLLETISKCQERINPDLTIGGIIITMYKKNTVLSRDVLEFTSSRFSDLLFKTKIADNISLAESPAAGKDIFRYHKSSIGSLHYSNLCLEIINRFE